MDGYENRNMAFSQGQMTQGVTAPPSLQQAAQKYNSMVPQGVKPSVSGVGMSSDQYQKTLGGLLKNQNGVSDSQFMNTMGGRFRNPNGTAQDTYEVGRYNTENANE